MPCGAPGRTCPVPEDPPGRNGYRCVVDGPAEGEPGRAAFGDAAEGALAPDALNGAPGIDCRNGTPCLGADAEGAEAGLPLTEEDDDAGETPGLATTVVAPVG